MLGYFLRRPKSPDCPRPGYQCPKNGCRWAEGPLSCCVASECECRSHCCNRAHRQWVTPALGSKPPCGGAAAPGRGAFGPADAQPVEHAPRQDGSVDQGTG